MDLNKCREKNKVCENSECNKKLLICNNDGRVLQQKITKISLTIESNNKEIEKVITHKQNIPDIKNIQDLQNYLKATNLEENEGLNLVSRFLISDDFYSKQNGVVFDVTGFDGLPMAEKIYPVKTIERDAQRARSAAKIHVNDNKILIDLRLLKCFLFV